MVRNVIGADLTQRRNFYSGIPVTKARSKLKFSVSSVATEISPGQVLVLFNLLAHSYSFSVMVHAHHVACFAPP